MVLKLVEQQLFDDLRQSQKDLQRHARQNDAQAAADDHDQGRPVDELSHETPPPWLPAMKSAVTINTKPPRIPQTVARSMFIASQSKTRVFPSRYLQFRANEKV